MADDTMKVDIGLEVHSTGEELIDELSRKLDALNRKIKSIASASAAIGRSVSTPGGSSTSTNGNAASKSARDALGVDRASVAELKRKLTVTSWMASQRQREERAAFADYRARMSFKMKADAADMRALRDKAQEEARSFRQRMSFTSRMGKLAIAEERKLASERARSMADAARQEAKRSRDVARSIRENARLESAESRHVDRERSARESARSRGYSSVRQGASDLREGAGRAVRGAGTMSAAAVAGSGAAIRRGVSTRMDVDSSETAIRIFSGQTQEQIRSARKGWLDTEAIKNGLSVSGGLDAYGEVLKAGLKGPVENTKSIMAATSALELDLKQTTKLAGLIDRNYGASSTPAKIKRALNAIAVAAREDPTAAPEIVEGMRRGFGILSMGNMTPEDLAAFVSGGQSVGIQPGKAGTFIATLGKQLSSGANRFLGKKNRQELNFAASKLGFDNAKAMANAFQGDSTGTIFKVLEGLKATDAQTRTTIAGALSGNQWNDEDLQIVNGLDGLKSTYNAIRDSRNAGFLDEAAAQRQASLQGQWNSTKAIFGRFWDAFGSGFEDILNSINSYFLDLNASFDYQKIKGYVSEFVEGVREAFGASTWKELFQSTFGGNLGNVGADIRAFAKGLTEGVLSIARGFRSALSLFSGGNASAETIGRLSGQFVALSIALVALGPVVGILGGLASIIAGLAVAGRGLAGLAGMGAGAAAGAGLMRGLGLALSKMFALSVVAEIGANRGVISTWMIDGAKALLSAVMDGIKSAFSPESIQAAMRAVVSEMIPAPLQRWMESNGQEEKKSLPGKVLDGLGKPPVQVAPSERGMLGKAWDWLSSALVGSAHAAEMEGRPSGPGANRLADAVEANTAAIRSTFDSPVSGLGGLLHRAAITGTGSAQAVRASITDSAGQVRSAIGSPTSPLSGSTASGGFGIGPLAGSTPGSALNGGSGLSRRGIIGGTRSTPGTGIVAPMLKGDAASNAKIAYDFFRSKGLSHEATAGILASMKQESGFHPMARGDGGRAHGLFQHHPDRRAAIMRGTGVDMSRASVADQLRGAWFEMESGSDAGAKRALRILKTPGISARDAGAAFVQHFERPARDERASRGAMAEGFARQFGQGVSGIPGLGGSGQYDGLRVKGSQAYAGGSSYQGVTDLARQVQANLPGGVKHFSAFNDRYHQGTRSKHASGLAFDTTLIDAARSSEAAEAIRSKIRAAGITDDAFKVIDEYRNPSARSTGGHLHTQFNSAEAAKRYSDYIASVKAGSGGDLAAKADAIKSGGWRRGAGGNAGALGVSTPLGTNTPMRQPNVQNGAGGAGGSASTTNNSITIQGAGQDAESIANAVQRKLNDKINRRTTDFSPSTLSV